MKTIGIIPVRYASVRFPGKPLIDIGGKSMIRRVYEQASKVSSFQKIVVATDDDRIFDHVKSFGEVMMTSSNHVSGTDRCGEIINSLKEDFDVVVNIQGDEPLIHPESLTLLINQFEKGEKEIATLIYKITDEADLGDPNIVKVVIALNHQALYFSRSEIPYMRNSVGDELLYYKHLGIYAYSSKVLKQLVQLPPSPLEQAECLEQLRWMQNGLTIHVTETTHDAISVDTPEDAERILGYL